MEPPFDQLTDKLLVGIARHYRRSGLNGSILMPFHALFSAAVLFLLVKEVEVDGYGFASGWLLSHGLASFA